MAMNPIQFQPGMSLSELFDEYGTEQKCEKALENARWPQGFVYPHCGVSDHSNARTGRYLCIPVQTCHPFHGKPATHSIRKLPPIPGKPATH